MVKLFDGHVLETLCICIPRCPSQPQGLRHPPPPRLGSPHLPAQNRNAYVGNFIKFSLGGVTGFLQLRTRMAEQTYGTCGCLFSGFIFFLRMQLVCCAVLGKPKWNTHPLINQAGPTTVGLKCDPTRWEDPLVQIRPSDSWRSETSMPLMVEELSRLAVGRARQAMMLTVSKGVVSGGDFNTVESVRQTSSKAQTISLGKTRRSEKACCWKSKVPKQARHCKNEVFKLPSCKPSQAQPSPPIQLRAATPSLPPSRGHRLFLVSPGLTSPRPAGSAAARPPGSPRRRSRSAARSSGRRPRRLW